MILTEPEINKISGGSVDYFDRIVFARAIEAALLAKLRGGVELPEPDVRIYRGFATHSTKQLLAYGAAQRLAAREQQWLPIESAPKDGTEILLYSLGDVGVCYWRDDEVMTGWTWGLGKAFGLPTHWQPLPPPPASPQEQT